MAACQGGRRGQTREAGVGFVWRENPDMASRSERLAVRLIQTGKGQWHQLGEVFGEEDQSAFAEHVLDGVDAAIVGKGHAQPTPGRRQ